MKIKTEEIEKLVSNYNKGHQWETSTDDFISHARRYIKACKEKRLMCSIGSVSQSGMSRTLKIVEMDKTHSKQFSVYNFYQLYDVLGYQKVKDSDYFRINGCGMDMVFATNYGVIHTLHRLGLINKRTCESLAQNTPHVI